MSIETKLAWKIRAMNLMRRTTRPVGTHPGPILSAHEIKIMESAWQNGWSPKDFCRILVKSDKRELSGRSPVWREK